MALLVAPIIFFQRKRKAKKRRLLQDFTAKANEQELAIGPHEFWAPYYAIGLDPVKKKLLYTRHVEGVEQQVLVDLLEVSSARVINLSKDSNDGRIIDRIDLAFAYRNTKRPEKMVEFYNKEESLNLNDELRLAEKWMKLVNENIATSAAPASTFEMAK